MDWSGFARRLGESCDVPTVRLPTGTVLRPKRGPLDVRTLLAEFASASDLAAWAEGSEDGLPGNAAAVLGGRWRLAEVVMFEWESMMTTWFASLDLFNPGDGREYVTLFLEHEPPFRIMAALEPKARLESLTEFFRTLLADNGKLYGVEVFGSLPTTTTVQRPDLLDIRALRHIYFDWMESAVQAGFATWADLRDSYLHGGLRPATDAGPLAALQRAAAGIGRFGNPSDPKAILQWLRSRQQEGDDLSEEDRRRIIENYCEASIRDATQQAGDDAEP